MSPKKALMVWSQPRLQGTVPSPRAGHTTTFVSAHNKLFVIGGFDGKIALADVHILHLGSSNVDSWNWAPSSGMIPIYNQQSSNASFNLVIFKRISR